MGESLLNIALRTPVKQLTDKQKDRLRASRAALSEAEVERLTKAGVLEAEETEEAEA